MPLDGRAVAVRSSGDGSVFVAFEYPENGVSVVDILHFGHFGQLITTIPIRLGTSNVKLADLVVRKSIPDVTPADPIQIQDLFVVLNVDELVASPATRAVQMASGAGCCGRFIPPSQLCRTL